MKTKSEVIFRAAGWIDRWRKWVGNAAELAGVRVSSLGEVEECGDLGHVFLFRVEVAGLTANLHLSPEEVRNEHAEDILRSRWIDMLKSLWEAERISHATG